MDHPERSVNLSYGKAVGREFAECKSSWNGVMLLRSNVVIWSVVELNLHTA